jgi:uncharacterized protein (TIGR02453 family)
VASPFTPRTLAFLRALKRNNDREWFREHKAAYERDVRGPMLEVLDRLAGDFGRFAPELVSEPRVSLYRIYRDTRFSADKSPLKTHAAAHFPSRALPKGRSAGLYFHLSPTEVWIGGGLYMPSAADLRLIREHIAAHHGRLRRAVTSTPFVEAVGTLDGEQLTRVPRGYPRDHKAADYLRFKQFLAGREYPAAFATSPRFYPELLRVYRAILPMVRFLNEALAPVAAAPPQRVF